MMSEDSILADSVAREGSTVMVDGGGRGLIHSISRQDITHKYDTSLKLLEWNLGYYNTLYAYSSDSSFDI